jgi:lysosomal acid lipase/cholesteryl ester hydrolase
MFLISTSSGQFDLPAMIDFALLKSGQKDLHYIGHSQGTTSFFVMASLRAEMNAKIRTMHAFGMELQTNIC